MARVPLTPRAAAEAIEQFGDDLAALDRAFTDLVERMPSRSADRVNDVEHQERLCTIAETFRALGDQMCRELDAADDAADPANPLAPDQRRPS